MRLVDPSPISTNAAVLASRQTASFNTVAACIPFPFTEAPNEAPDPKGSFYGNFSVKLRQSFLGIDSGPLSLSSWDW